MSAGTCADNKNTPGQVLAYERHKQPNETRPVSASLQTHSHRPIAANTRAHCLRTRMRLLTF